MNEKEQQEKVEILDVYNKFEDLVDFIKTLKRPDHISVNCNFDLYILNTEFEFEVFCEKVKIYKITITIQNTYISLVFLTSKTKNGSIGITINKHQLKQFKERGLVIDGGKEKYFTNKILFLFELGACRKDHINKLFNDLVEVNNMYDKICKDISTWD